MPMGIQETIYQASLQYGMFPNNFDISALIKLMELHADINFLLIQICEIPSLLSSTNVTILTSGIHTLTLMDGSIQIT